MFSVLSRAWNEKKNLSPYEKSNVKPSLRCSTFFIFYRAQNLPSHFFYHDKHDAIDIADPSCSMQDACYMNFEIQFNVESLWLSGRASQRGIRRSELRFLMGTHSLVTRRKTIFSIILNSYKCGNLRLLNVLSCGPCGKKGNPTQQQRDLELLFLLDYGGKSERVNMFLNNAN